MCTSSTKFVSMFKSVSFSSRRSNLHFFLPFLLKTTCACPHTVRKQILQICCGSPNSKLSEKYTMYGVYTSRKLSAFASTMRSPISQIVHFSQLTAGEAITDELVILLPARLLTMSHQPLPSKSKKKRKGKRGRPKKGRGTSLDVQNRKDKADAATHK